MTTLRAWLGVVVVALAGCGGGSSVDLTGMYRVDTAVGSTPCGLDQALPAIPPFLRFSKDNFLGQDYFKYDGCMDEAGTDCATTGSLFTGFFEPIDDGWRGIVTSSSGSGGSCTLGYFEQTAILKDLRLVVEGTSYRETVDLSADACQPEEAERRGDAMPCEEHERIDATRLP